VTNPSGESGPQPPFTSRRLDANLVRERPGETANSNSSSPTSPATAVSPTTRVSGVKTPGSDARGVFDLDRRLDVTSPPVLNKMSGSLRGAPKTPTGPSPITLKNTFSGIPRRYTNYNSESNKTPDKTTLSELPARYVCSHVHFVFSDLCFVEDA